MLCLQKILLLIPIIQSQLFYVLLVLLWVLLEQKGYKRSLTKGDMRKQISFLFKRVRGLRKENGGSKHQES